MQKISWRPAEIAAATGLSQRFVQEALTSKELPSRRLGGARIVMDRDLRAWLESAAKPEAAAAR